MNSPRILQWVRASAADAQKLFDWKNDPGTRQGSHNSREVTWQEHLNWFTGVLQNTDREIYLARYENTDVGLIRRDRKDQEWLLSWVVSPSRRGQGFGKQMLYQFVRAFPASYSAEIKNENLPSIQMSREAGFSLREQKEGFQEWFFKIS